MQVDDGKITESLSACQQPFEGFFGRTIVTLLCMKRPLLLADHFPTFWLRPRLHTVWHPFRWDN